MSVGDWQQADIDAKVIRDIERTVRFELSDRGIVDLLYVLNKTYCPMCGDRRGKRDKTDHDCN